MRIRTTVAAAVAAALLLPAAALAQDPPAPSYPEPADPGKVTPKPGRKMGHLTATGRTVHEAQDLVVAARDALLR